MTKFKGAYTALITPMNGDGSVDYEGFRTNVKFQLEQGIDGLVPLGTTAETPTLDEKPGSEEDKLIQIVMDEVRAFEKSTGKKIPVILGAGSNNTKDAVMYCERAKKAGADAALVVTPYYNKTTQEGIIRHYTEIAKKTNLPIILYNVPSRTGVNIKPETAYELSKVENIVAIKEASGDLSQIAKTASLCRDNLKIYSGNDDQTIPILSLGGIGVISVLSNVKPKYTHEMCYHFFNNEIEKATKMQLDAIDLINALFSEVNPIPVKEALNILGYNYGEPRLPLIPLSKLNKENLEKCLKDLNKKI